jgi:hypothetical protein
VCPSKLLQSTTQFNQPTSSHSQVTRIHLYRMLPQTSSSPPLNNSTLSLSNQHNSISKHCHKCRRLNNLYLLASIKLNISPNKTFQVEATLVLRLKLSTHPSQASKLPCSPPQHNSSQAYQYNLSFRLKISHSQRRNSQSCKLISSRPHKDKMWPLQILLHSGSHSL